MNQSILEEIVSKNIKLTPMMEQYYQIKKSHPDTMLLFRMGDFYEVFFEDAIEAAKILNIAQTHRGKIADYPIPMAGIPHHAAATYVDRLTEAGLKVAICEQVQDPKDAKGIVKRAVTQVVSPSMPYDLEKTQGIQRHYMAAALYTDQRYFSVMIDFTTGDFFGEIFTNGDDYLDHLQLFAPKEFLTFMGQWQQTPIAEKLESILKQQGTLKTHLSAEYFDSKFNQVYRQKIVKNLDRDKIIKMHGQLLSPIGALCYYISTTQNAHDETEQKAFAQIRPFRLINRQGLLKVTLHTLRGLEIFPKSKESYKDSLLGFMDRTQTALGGRRIKLILQSPFTDLKKIEKRQDFITSLVSDESKLQLIREHLSYTRDLERILTKATTNKATASDLINTAESIRRFFEVAPELSKTEKLVCGALSSQDESALNDLADEIEKYINDELGASLDKGNLIREGANKKRDKLAKMAFHASKELELLEQKYRDDLDIPKLRIKSNNVAGHFIEVSKNHTHKVPQSFKRRQTLVNAERYTTDELIDFEKEVMQAREQLEKLEREIFKDLITQFVNKSKTVQKLADFIAALDVFQSLAWVALQEGLTRPVISQKEKIFKVTGAWHPLIKSILKDEFVGHDLTLNQDKFFGLITGPNMAGKTTVMREVAIIQLLAQVGSFVPASSATVGICDYLFSRLGASDDILRGQSTFMVEMSETAEIIRHAGERSLIILDEVGRGTSTFDGLSIAWALVEHLINNTKALTLFATHYHELIDLIDQFEQAKNLTVEIKNDDGDIHFLYRLIEAPASQSFGIHVAKMAGIPQELLERSQELLEHFEKQAHHQKSESFQQLENIQLSFFPAPDNKVHQSVHDKGQDQQWQRFSKWQAELENIDILNMTPLQALETLQKYKQEFLQ